MVYAVECVPFRLAMTPHAIAIRIVPLAPIRFRSESDVRRVCLLLSLLILLPVSAFAEPITFTFAPVADVKTVAVRGSFNGWGESPMTRGADGVWSVTLELDPGEHVYKYFVDGQWPQDMQSGLNGGPLDPQAQSYVDDGFGGRNAVRLVGAAREDSPAVEPTPSLREGFARLHYHRPDGRYAGWGLHVWEDTTENVTWEQALPPAGRDDFGVWWDVALRAEPRKLGLLVHRGDEKDPGPDQYLDLSLGMREAWIVSGVPQLFVEAPDLGALPTGDLEQRRAHWVDATTIVWPGLSADATSFSLHHEADGTLELTREGVRGGEAIELQGPVSSFVDFDGRWPHLANAPVLTLDAADRDRALGFLRGRLAVSALRADGSVADATGLQIPGVLDDVYAHDGPLGVRWEGDVPSLALWAPTARDVRLLIYDTANDLEPSRSIDLLEERGVWSVRGVPGWKDLYYQYEVTVYQPATGRIEVNRVTDPYSRSLSANSRLSQMIDLADPRWMPDGWTTLQKPPIDAPEDIVLYELHVRDFSATDSSVPSPIRGTFLAFTFDTHGTRHLRSLAEAGLTHVHLLPVFDIATVPERPEDQRSPGDLSGFAPDSEEQQAAIARVKDQDPYNWGYDPWHFGVPEGSYATDPDGAVRVREFRGMVQALAQMGLRVVMDVVYNHTHASGQAREAVLDRIVPGYYHRLDDTGNVTTSTCCQNTATEHRMMEKLMIDDLVHWAVHHKVDGFRFDLMGHHMKRNLERARDALAVLTLESDGVDGRSIYLYGEGWDFGEVAKNARGVNATQINLAGTGIGTFNDRLRDAVRGGSPFTDRREQGFATGLHHAPNGMPGSDEATRLRELTDRIRVGLAGNLREYRVGGRPGSTMGGYTLDPQEAIQYVSAHDNETLFDKVQLAAPSSATLEERVAMHRLALGIAALAQGVPFFHAGSELLRSKSMDADSYNSGDWFNRLDFTGATTTWGAGLPPAEKNRDRWPIMRTLLAREDLRPTPTEILDTAEHFRSLLRVRGSSPLFRLREAADIEQRLVFHETPATPGLIVMAIHDVGDEIEDLDPLHERLVAFFNPAATAVQFGDPRWGRFAYEVHPEHAQLAASFDRATGVFTIPPRAVVVFVVRQNG
jgi:pullulanase